MTQKIYVVFIASHKIVRVFVQNIIGFSLVLTGHLLKEKTVLQFSEKF